MQFETLSIILLATILSYLLGSIPFGVIVAKFCKVDIQNVGSGNIGATNVLRTLGPVAGGVVFVLDLLKGTLAAVLAIWLLPSPLWIILASSMSIIGHMFPVFLKFKGGRGSATGLGVLLAIAPDVFLGAFILVVIIIGATRYVSLASITVPPLVTIYMYAAQKPFPYSTAALLVTLLIIYRHIPNIQRLLAGTERKIRENI